jgi:hypothetical protein
MLATANSLSKLIFTPKALSLFPRWRLPVEMLRFAPDRPSPAV